ncbi:ComEC/Rec2 family competence protein [Nannocystaceae bacterium ST9]
MRTILVALGCLLGLIVGAWLGRIEGRIEGCEPLVLALVGGASLLAALAWLALLVASERSAARWATLMVAALVIAGGLLRGASVGPAQRERALVRSERAGPGHQPDRLRELEVVGASEPGPRCTLEVRELGGSQAGRFELEVGAAGCPRSGGERVAVMARELEAGSSRAPSHRDAWTLADERVPWSRPIPARGVGARWVAAYWAWVAATRQRAWEVSRGDRAASLSAAIGLGLRSTLDADDREALRDSGLGHLIAVSGLQVALAGLWLQVLVRRMTVLLGGSTRLTCVITWLPLIGYVGLTGAAAPAVRSALMLVALDLGTLLGRPTHGPTLLALVAAGMGLFEPAWVLDPGFQLSVAAMAAIVTAPADQGVLASSWRITWVTAPLTLIHFDVAPLHALLGNAIALPLFSFLMPASLIGWASYERFGGLALQPARAFAEPILDVAELLARVPGADARLLAGLALLALIVDRIRRVRAGIHEPAPSSWLPPKLACAWVLITALPLALGWPPASLATALAHDRFDWVAVGSPSSRSLVIRDRRSGILAPRACLIRPVLGAGDTEILLARLGVGELEVIVESPTEARMFESEDPRAYQLRRELERAGIPVREGSLEHCPQPAKSELNAALRACQNRHGGRGRVLVRAFAGHVGCWSHDRWLALPELELQPDR